MRKKENYPLSEVSTNDDVWCAMQYDRPKESDGLIIACRREKSPYEKAYYKLGGINSNKEYIFSDADGGKFTVSGKELAKKVWNLQYPKNERQKYTSARHDENKHYICTCNKHKVLF